MSAELKDRHRYGAGAAACAVCCAPPILALIGLAGAGIAATVATVVLAGVAFGLVALAATLLGVWAREVVGPASPPTLAPTTVQWR
jgi:hypothetical protein